MATDDTIKLLKERLIKVPGITPIQLEVLTSDVLLKRVTPIMTAFVAEQIEQQQKVKDKTGESARSLIEKIMKGAPPTPGVSGFITDISDGLYDTKWIEETISSIQDHWLFAPILGIIITAVHISTSVYNYVSVSAEKTRQKANEDIRPYLLDIGTLVKEFFRHPENYAWVQEQMMRMGIDDKKIGIYLQNEQNLLPVDFLRVLWNRGEINDGQLDIALRSLQFKEDDFSNIKTAMKVYPGAQDLVRFAVREVFDETFAQQAGLFSDLPPAFIEEAKKAGLPEPYAKMFWGAHWVPPSINQAFEMFQRQVIDKKELNTLLRIGDVMPNYREKLTEIAYNPITRVDIRRLYQDGIVDFARMVNLYRDVGYSPDNAELLAEWTDRKYGEERKQRTRADILKLYKLGEFTAQDTIDTLQDIGYSYEIAQEYLTRIDLEEQEKALNNQIKVWKKGFVNYAYSQTEVKSIMQAGGMQNRDIDNYLSEWQSERDSKIRHLSVKDIERLFGADLLNGDGVWDHMIVQGYEGNDILLLIQLWGKENGDTTE